MARLAPIDPQSLSPRQKDVHDTILNGPRGRVGGPFAIWLRRPDLAATGQALGRYCRYDTLLAPRLSELAILVTARLWMAEFEWAAHKPPALAAGLAPEIVETIRTGQSPSFLEEDEAVVYAFTVALHQQRRIDDALYARAVAALGEPGVVDLTGLLGYYTLVSMTLNVFEVAPPEGAEPQLI